MGVLAVRAAHIAFGSNQGMPGGLNSSKTHIDYLFNEPTIEVKASSGEVCVVMENGIPIQ